MLDDRDRAILVKGHGFHFMFWLALMVALVVYLVICHINADTRQVRELNEGAWFLRDVVTGFSLLALMLAWLFKRMMLAVKEPLTRLAALVSTRSVERYRTAFMMTQATAHSIALFGLALFYSGYGTPTLYLFTCIAAVGQIWFMPRPEELRRYTRKQKQLVTGD